MWLRGRINYEPRIGTLWNVPTHAKFWRPLQHHLKAGQGYLRNSDTFPGAIAGGHFQIISRRPVACFGNSGELQQGRGEKLVASERTAESEEYNDERDSHRRSPVLTENVECDCFGIAE